MFKIKTKIISSRDLVADTDEIMILENVRRVLLCIDSNLNNELTNATVKKIENKYDTTVYSYNYGEPTTGIIDEISNKYRKAKFDIIIGIGGGSVLDTAKALSVMLVNDGSVEDYHGTGKPFTASVKKILIPTTSGTGCEVTPGAVLINERTKFKRGIGGEHVQSDYAILNGELTLSMPESVLAATGMDALAHAVESYVSKPATNITRMFAKEAFKLIFNNLPLAFEAPKDIEIREKLLLGSCLAGISIANSDTGACHALAYPLGIYNNVPHGVAVAQILPLVIEINLEKGFYKGYAELYREIVVDNDIEDEKRLAEKFCNLINNYNINRKIEKSLADFGINLSNYKFLAERGLDLKPALNSNPVEFGLSDSERVLKKLL